MNHFNIGDRVWTELGGLATVEHLSNEYVGVISDTGRKGMIKLEGSNIRLARPSDEVAMIASEIQSEQQAEERETFFQHPDEEWQSQGGHLAIYNDGDEHRFLNALQSIIKDAERLPMDNDRVEIPILGNSSVEYGIYLGGFMPNTKTRDNTPELIAIIAKKREQDGHFFASLYPYWQPQERYEFVLNEVLVWSAGLEANLYGEIADTEISWFDTRFLSHQQLYQTGNTYQVRLMAHGYSMSPDDLPTEITIEQDSDRASIMAWLKDSNMEDELNMTISMSNMLMGNNVSHGHDDYQFRGQLTSVIERTFLGLDCYECRLSVHADKQPIPLMIPVTNWDGNEPPKQGQQVTGSFWLTGEVIQ